MSYFRSYFNKNNTILKDLTTNTAKNPATEIFYGSGFSKFIFQVDLTDLQSKLSNGDLVLNENTTHTLHLTNTIFGDEDLSGQERGTGRERAVSFDLILFVIPEDWDEGVGYDYEYVYDYTTGNLTWDVRPSNWFNKNTLSGWTEEGIYSGTTAETWTEGGTYTGSPVVLSTIHFDNGNEHIAEDITSYINAILTGTTQNYGLGLAFAPAYESVSSDIDQSVAFFTKYTQTFWEPYVETIFNNRIDDNRENFFIEANRNLYLYVNYMGSPYNLDELPTVDILDYTSTEISGLTGLTTTHIRKGVYKVTFGLSGYLCDGKRFYYDKWCNLIISGITLDCVTQKFIPKQFANFFDIGTNLTDVNKYAVQFYGISLNEKIKRGSTRKIVVSFRSINETKTILLDETYYRIYVKEGKTQVNVFEWTRMDRTNENSFILDTSYMIPREYNIEIKGLVNGQDVIYKDEIKFEIISEK